MTHTKKRTILYTALALALAAAVFLTVKIAAANTSASPTVSADSATSDSAAASASSASAGNASTVSAAEFVFSDSGIAVTGSSSGTEIDGTALTIDEPGTYTVSGTCADGSIKIKKGTTGVTLILNGLDLTSTATAPITCAKSSEVTILAADGTENILTDSAQNNDDEYPENTDAENAVIKCKDGSTVTLGGTGSLTVNANGKNGIKSGATTDEEGEASLTIQDLALTITASVNDAINAEQTLNIPSGTLTISAADDAIHADYELSIGASGTDGPAITIIGCYEGLEAATLNIFSGNIDITATDDCLNAANSDLAGYAFTMTISGGTIHAYTSGGDGFDSNGDLTISGGTVVVWTANSADNQPLDADGTITITGGTVLAAGGSSGMGTNLSATQPYVTFGSSTMGGMGGFSGGKMQPPTGDRPDDMPELPDGAQPGDMGTPPDGAQSGNMGTPPDGAQSGDMGTPPDGFGGAASAASVAKGSTLTITSGSDTLLSEIAPCDVRFVFFSAPGLAEGESCTLSADSETVETADAQTGEMQSGFGGKPTGEAPALPDGETSTLPSGEAPALPSGETPASGDTTQPPAPPTGDTATPPQAPGADTAT